MCRRSLICAILVAIAILGDICCCMAQGVTSDYEDYRQYKFYEEGDMWWIAIPDTLPNIVDIEERNVHLGRSARSWSARSEAILRGERYGVQRYSLSGLDIGYGMVRGLASLGLKSEHVGSDALTTHLDLVDKYRHSNSHLGVEFSGRNYLAGVNYGASHYLERDGVELDDGWGITHYARMRTGRDLYIGGVYTNMLIGGLAASYEDKTDVLHLILNFSLSERGLHSSSVAEAYRLTDNTLYNPSWGMQCGRERNSRVARELTPEVLAYWSRRLTLNTTLRLVANVGYARTSRSGLSWYDAPTPMPDNYHYLPSYQTDVTQRLIVEEAWHKNDMQYTQVDWDALYHTNMLQRDGHARYAVDSRMEDCWHGDALALLCSRLADVDVECTIDMGYRFDNMYRRMEDLLGAEHIIDKDYYLEDDTAYGSLSDNNLRNPRREVHEGDRFGYDYVMRHLHGGVAVGCSWRRGGVALSLGGRIGWDWLRRYGRYEKELFAGSASYGTSQAIITSPYRLSATCRYVSGEHRVTANLHFEGRGHDADNLFFAPEYNNRTVGSRRPHQLLNIDCGYGFDNPRLSLRATVFLRLNREECDVVRYYDDVARLYVDGVVSGVERIGCGVDASLRATWSRMFSSNFMVVAAQYRYISNPHVALYADRDNSVVAVTHSHMRSLHVGAPELMLYGDVVFRSPDGWGAELAVSYQGFRYVAPSYMRRTQRLLSLATTTEEYDMLMCHERMPDAVNIDLSISKRLRFRRGGSLYLSLVLQNVASAVIVQSGYEQHRVRMVSYDGHSYLEPFASRLRYMRPCMVRFSANYYF